MEFTGLPSDGIVHSSRHCLNLSVSFHYGPPNIMSVTMWTKFDASNLSWFVHSHARPQAHDEWMWQHTFGYVRVVGVRPQMQENKMMIPCIFHTTRHPKDHLATWLNPDVAHMHAPEGMNVTYYMICMCMSSSKMMFVLKETEWALNKELGMAWPRHTPTSPYYGGVIKNLRFKDCVMNGTHASLNVMKGLVWLLRQSAVRKCNDVVETCKAQNKK